MFSSLTAPITAVLSKAMPELTQWLNEFALSYHQLLNVWNAADFDLFYYLMVETQQKEDKLYIIIQDSCQKHH